MPPTNAEYAKINIACKELGLDKYQLLHDRYGIESSKQLTRFQTGDLLSHFKKLGFKVKRKRKSQSSPVYNDAGMRKVVALWITLYKEKVVRDRSDRALQSFVKRQTGIANLRWCDTDDIMVLIETLKKWAEREGVEL